VDNKFTQGVKMMKKGLLVALFVIAALGLFTGVASAQAAQPQVGTIHDYMEKALAEKLGLPLATVEAQFDGGKSLFQIALDNGITQQNMATFMLDVRIQAVQAAVADGVLTQTQADWMLQRGGRGMGAGMMNANGSMFGAAGSCSGSGIPVGSGLGMRGRGQQVRP